MTLAEPFAVLHETHTAVVVLFGGRAYKIKKPVVTDFLDFSTHDRRARACARELELNRRLSPDVYLGVGQVSDPAGGPDEHMLVMRRLPDAARLANRLDDPDAPTKALPALVRLLAGFHDAADHGADVDRAATVDALRGRWSSLLSGLTDPPIDPARVEQVSGLAMRYLIGRKPLFDKRIATRRIVDGHGDLHAGDIFALPDGIRVLDCLDFDDELRHVDRLDDIAFLAMDLKFLGRPDLAQALVEDYLTLTNDPAPVSLCDHYIAYRAIVRAKVNCIRHRQGDPDAAVHADRHIDLALHHLESGAVRLALVGGLPGTGKSTVARALGESTGAIVLSSDRIRAVRHVTGVLSGDSGRYGCGAYSPAAKAQVYTVLRAEAQMLLAAGRSVVLDASWIDSGERRSIAGLTDGAGADLIQFRCTAPQSVTDARLCTRTGSDSEATPAIARAMAADADRWPEAIELDTTASLSGTTALAMQAWQAAPHRKT